MTLGRMGGPGSILQHLHAGLRHYVAHFHQYLAQYKRWVASLLILSLFWKTMWQWWACKIGIWPPERRESLELNLVVLESAGDGTWLRTGFFSARHGQSVSRREVPPEARRTRLVIQLCLHFHIITKHKACIALCSCQAPSISLDGLSVRSHVNDVESCLISDWVRTSWVDSYNSCSYL